ncbi:hypothetical protein ACNKHW_18595 [Shigella flexneri]
MWGGLSDISVSQRPPFFQFLSRRVIKAFKDMPRIKYFVDPCKPLLTTPGIHAETGEDSDFWRSGDDSGA